MLYKAAEQGRTDIARLLLARGVPFNDPDRFGWTPLGTAAKAGHADLVELLASQRGIALECRNGQKGQLTPLQLAAIEGHADVVKVLIAKGADVNDCGGQQWSPRQGAEQRGFTNIVESLKAAGAR